MLVSATPTTHFIAYCKPCLRPTRITDTSAPERVGHLPATCPECGAQLTAQRLYGTKIAAVCNSLCMGATGPNCSCQCGGDNHGKAFSVYESEMLHDSLQRHRADVARREAARVKRQEAKNRAARADFDAWAEENQDVVEFLGDGRQLSDPWGRDAFLYEMAGPVGRYEPRRPLTPRQTDAVRRCIAARQRFEAACAEREATAKPCPTGPAIEIKGKIVKAWDEDNPYGRDARYIMTVRGDGWDVRMSIPRALQDVNATTPNNTFGLVGREVSVVVDVERSRKSESYGFGKRPRQARLV